MCHEDPSICRCGFCFLAKLNPARYIGNPGILGPGPFRGILAEYEKEERSKKKYSFMPDAEPEKAYSSKDMRIIYDVFQQKMNEDFLKFLPKKKNEW